MIHTTELEGQRLYELAEMLQRIISQEKPAPNQYPKTSDTVQHKGTEWLSEDFLSLPYRKRIGDSTFALTHREIEVLGHMTQGRLNKQIAKSLGISEQTIKNHVTSILRKLNATRRTDAVVIALKRGLVTL